MWLLFLPTVSTLILIISTKECPNRAYIEQSLLDVPVPGATIVIANEKDGCRQVNISPCFNI